jgi:hypothetical protein
MTLGESLHPSLPACGDAATSLFFPAANIFPPRPLGDDLFALFMLADTSNLRDNELPSVPVCYAFTRVHTHDSCHLPA